MSTEPSDYQKHLILFVDDEDKTRKYFKRLFGKTFRIVLACDGVEALEILKQQTDDIGLIVTDQKMPHETGVAFLEKAVRLKPSIVRILSTAYAEIETAIDSVNKGGVYRYVTKPWDVAEFEVTLRRAMEYYLLQSQRDELVQKHTSGLKALAIWDRVVSLAALAAARDSGLRHIGEALLALSQIFARCGTSTTISSPSLSWPELYKRHHAFLARAISLLPKTQGAQTKLDVDQPASASAVLANVTRRGGRISAVAGGTPGAVWPGLGAQVTEVVGSLLAGLEAVLKPSEEVTYTDQVTGVELTLPEASLAAALEPLFGSADKVPDESSFRLLAGFLRFADAGGTFEVLPSLPGAQTVGLRIGFAPSRIQNPTGDALEAIATDLIGNELFWSRPL